MSEWDRPEMATQLIVEPDDGLGPVLDFIRSARTSLLVKQFTFTEPRLVEAVIDRRRAGVDVRVMLNAKRSAGDRANDDTYEQLHNAGVAVQWSNPKFYVTHEKSIVVDSQVAMVATYNLMIKYFTMTRDYGIITHDPVHVKQIVDVFDADWDHREFTPAEDVGLLWSNSNSRYQMARFIDRATETLHVQHPPGRARSSWCASSG
jgi:phosphatidylserine/phosphatidylglycerophosphate/cardiolipin synthase-like enzyme